MTTQVSINDQKNKEEEGNDLGAHQLAVETFEVNICDVSDSTWYNHDDINNFQDARSHSPEGMGEDKNGDCENESLSMTLENTAVNANKGMNVVNLILKPLNFSVCESLVV